MKIAANSSPNITSGEMKVSEMGVSAKRTPKLLGFVRDNIYSDKVRAVAQEYACNSIDEHSKFGVTQAVEISLRNNDGSLEYVARDFAKGLSDHDVRNIFAMSGESTKDKSDEQIGGWGLGTKCAMSYNTKSFFVHSHFEGTKTSYCFALGANADGEETGFVYELGSEPTNESGLEIVVPVAHHDTTEFSNKIRNFVLYSPHNIKANILGIEFAPHAPIFEKKVSDYNFRLIECEYKDTQKILFQMGGNTYESRAFVGPNGEKIKKDHCLVVDIPIGHCSITLSREAFEKTEKNSRVFAEIEGILNTLVEEDLSQFKTKTVLELVGDHLSEMKQYEGNMFAAYPSDLYGSSWTFAKSICRYSDSTIEEKNGKPICVVIPDNQATDHWRSKTKAYMEASGRNTYYVLMGFFSLDKFAEHFHFIAAKKLPYPKITRDQLRYTVYRRNRTRGKFSPLELFNHVSENFNWQFVAKTEKEARDYLDQKKKDAKNRQDLEKFTCRTTDGGKDTNYWTSNSEKFIEQLEKIGFLHAYSKETKDLIAAIEAVENAEQEKRNKLSRAKTSFVRLSPRTLKAVEKLKHAERITEFWSVVFKEDSLRAKIIKKFKDSNYGSLTLERKELRQILKMPKI